MYTQWSDYLLECRLPYTGRRPAHYQQYLYLLIPLLSILFTTYTYISLSKYRIYYISSFHYFYVITID